MPIYKYYRCPKRALGITPDFAKALTTEGQARLHNYFRHWHSPDLQHAR